MRTPTTVIRMAIRNGSFITPTMTNSRKKMTPPTTAPMALMPSQSLTRRSPGFPASARFFSVRSLNDALVTLATPPDMRAASGRSVRSMNGCWSSSSSRFLACIDPSWESRAWTGSTDEPPARLMKIRRIAPAATAAMTMGRSIGLDLDVDDLADEHEPDEHHESTDDEDDHAGRQAEDLGWRCEHRLHEAGRGDEQEAGQRDRQEADDVARQALLGGQGADLALDPDALADRERDRVEDLGEVAADLVLDGDGRRHQLEVIRADPADHVLERLVERQAEVDLTDDPAELRRDRRPRLADDQLDGLQEGRAGPQGVGDQGDGVRELLVEGAQPTALAAVEPETRDEEADEGSDEQEERVAQRREEEGQQVHARRDADDAAGPDEQVLRHLELEVGPGDLPGEVGAEVTLLDDPVEVCERLALGDEVGDGPLACRGGGLLVGLACRGIPLEAVRDPRSTGRRDADCDEQDRQGGDAGERERDGLHGQVSFRRLVREAEEARRQVDAHDLELLDELRPDPGRLEPALDLALDDAGLLEDEDVLHDDDIAFHALDLGDVDDLPGPVLEAALLDDEVHRGRDLLPDGPQGQVDAGHQDHRLEARQHVARAVGVAGRHRAVVAGVHGLEHVQGLTGTALSDDDPVRTHAQGVAHELADRDGALALDVRGPGFQRHDVLLAELQLGRVLDRHDPLVVRDEGGEDVERRGLARAGAAGHEDVEPGLHAR